MKKVFILTAGFSHEGEEVRGVFATEAEAHTARQKLADRKGIKYDTINIKAWAIGEFNDD